MTAVAVIAKECLPGKVKTRLQPDYTATEAAAIAAAALAETLELVGGLPASRRILYFDGAVVPPGADGWDILPQSGSDLDERIAHLFDTVDEPLLMLGMDTPQLNPEWLGGLFVPRWDADAWFGPATDGGFWALGMRHPDGSLVRGVPMSTEHTGRHQLERFAVAGLTVRLLPPLTDIDTADDLASAADGSVRVRQALDAIGRIRIGA